MMSTAFQVPADESYLSPEELQDGLSRLNDARLRPRTSGLALSLAEEVQLRQMEQTWLESECAVISARASAAPSSEEGFISWFEQLRETGPGQEDPLFPWLAEKASLEQMTWFLSQEVAGEAGFDDLVALTQLRLPVQAKLELARNYWDEMGRGKESGMHGPMLDRLAADLRLSARAHEVTSEAVSIGNLLMGLAANRGYAFHSVGALGAVELTAPSRAVHVARGLERLGVSQRGRRYYALHATLDVRHSAAWNQEVIRPLVREDPGISRSIAEGALMRLHAGARCFVRYRQQFGF